MTKNDVSCGEVKLDYIAMLETAKIANGQLQYSIAKYLDKIRDSKPNECSIYLNSRYLATAANNLVMVNETLHALASVLEDRSIEVVNISK